MVDLIQHCLVLYQGTPRVPSLAAIIMHCHSAVTGTGAQPISGFIKESFSSSCFATSYTAKGGVKRGNFVVSFLAYGFGTPTDCLVT